MGQRYQDAATDECIRLLEINEMDDPIETVFRLRALQDLSSGLNTRLLLKVLASVQHAQRSGSLERNIDLHLSGPGDLRHGVSEPGRLIGSGPRTGRPSPGET